MAGGLLLPPAASANTGAGDTSGPSPSPTRSMRSMGGCKSPMDSFFEPGCCMSPMDQFFDGPHGLPSFFGAAEGPVSAETRAAAAAVISALQANAALGMSGPCLGHTPATIPSTPPTMPSMPPNVPMGFGGWGMPGSGPQMFYCTPGTAGLGGRGLQPMAGGMSAAGMPMQMGICGLPSGIPSLMPSALQAGLAAVAAASSVAAAASASGLSALPQAPVPMHHQQPQLRQQQPQQQQQQPQQQQQQQ
eukprot:CAMPEP_0177258848 /NCGR_PEP_ID=MMETSP0367-20130122/58325_1 /TAXON_ID=447022 ORGANISM="Scrippsiella hangoei-like, Strain SHHI-4" /NCGR_SAMPLE_ID=MMETSP0367 /ASSEMBLY_ACC=CAM_ASM_000362 /LENGTH=246 /DNA_ID=CAMNT_0018713089 /DNA_START=6 /DNA_END=743 /DNA_ORIENTATION=+